MKGYLTNLSIGSYGRFANSCYQISAAIGISRKNGLTPVFKQWRNLDHVERFGSTEDIDVYKHFINPLPSLPAGVQFTELPCQWGYHNIALRPGNWNITGHFQSFKYFEHCADEVRYYFTMAGEKPVDACAIHYRAGDYQHGQQSYHPRMPLEYYASACEHFPANQKYLLFSDNRDEVEKIGKELRINHEVYCGMDYIEDFRMMKSCNNFIIANSTYSAFAAWLSGRGKVVSPSGYNWFGDVAGITGADIVHDSWIKIKFDKNKQYKILV